MNVIQLRSLITTLAARTDITDSLLDIYFGIIESELNQIIDRSKNTESVLDLQSTTGALALPPDYLRGRYLMYHNGNQDLKLNQTSLDKVLAERGNFNTHLDSYAQVGNNLLLNTFSDQENFTLYYYTGVPSIAMFSTSWVLDNYPNLYIYGCLEKIFDYALDEDKSDRFRMKFEAALLKCAETERINCYSGSSPIVTQSIQEL